MMNGNSGGDRQDERNETKFNGVDRRETVKLLGGALATSAVGSQISETKAANAGNNQGIDKGYGQDFGEEYDPEYEASRNQRVVSYWGSGDPYTIPVEGSFLATSQGLSIQRNESVEIGNEVVHQFLVSATTSFEKATDPDGPWDEIDEDDLSWEEDENINGILLEIVNDQSSSTSSIVAPDQGDERMVAATQSSGDDDIDWVAGLAEVTKTAVSELSKRANVAVAAYDIITAFKNNSEDIGDGQEVEYWWDFTNSVWDSDNTKQEAGASMRFYVEADDPSDGYDITARTNLKLDLEGKPIVSDEETRYIGLDISADFDVTSMDRNAVSAADVSDPYIRRKAERKGVSEVTQLSYNDTSEAVTDTDREL
jgi:hypothetical protein